MLAKSDIACMTCEMQTYLSHEVDIWRNGEEGSSSKVKVHEDLSEGRPVLGFWLPGKQVMNAISTSCCA